MDSKTLCLGALMLGDASGYEIKKLFEEGPFSYFHQSSFGSIYPALGKLMAEGLVTCDEHAQEGRPDKKVYSLTDKGRAAFRKALSINPQRDRIRSESMYMLFFAHLLDTGHVRKVYDGYLEGFRQNIECLDGLSSDGISPSRQFVRGFGRTFYEAAVKYMEENRHMLLPEDEAPKAKGDKT
ncbi:MAG: PadR family transcriptional regulator [Rhodospirillales bacterium]|nr:PadR family transcriptional regulator [Alphaproteobacteria bacterium]MBL6947623.1 PadR family transcriptional regulator [Rhodospirillales bacterium]